MSIRCTCCQSEISKNVVYSKKSCPVTNNVVYKTKEEALNSLVGDIELVRCSKCNFVFNCKYNEKLLDYNSNYNNKRSFSPAYNDYLGELIGFCSADIGKKTKILEIGCGEGEFLKRLCSRTGARGFGYDPAYRGESKCGENVSFSKRYFSPMRSSEKFNVVVLRHVLEHIPEPNIFLKSICDNEILLPDAKLWIEVPDFEWTLNKGIFYDITYEHCNYFCKQTLSDFITALGFNVITLKNIFDGQYILLEAEYTLGNVTKNKAVDSISSVSSLTGSFNKTKKVYDSLIRNAREVCVWGVSGKGVIFLSELSNAMLKKIKYVIDINPQKQECFLPVSGKKIESHEALRNIDGRLLVLVMNGIYEKEIIDTLDEMKVNARLHVFCGSL